MREKTEGGLRLCVGDIRGEGQTEGGLRLCVGDIRGEGEDRGRFEAMCG